MRGGGEGRKRGREEGRDLLYHVLVSVQGFFCYIMYTGVGKMRPILLGLSVLCTLPARKN